MLISFQLVEERCAFFASLILNGDIFKSVARITRWWVVTEFGNASLASTVCAGTSKFYCMRNFRYYLPLTSAGSYTLKEKRPFNLFLCQLMSSCWGRVNAPRFQLVEERCAFFASLKFNGDIFKGLCGAELIMTQVDNETGNLVNSSRSLSLEPRDHEMFWK